MSNQLGRKKLLVLPEVSLIKIAFLIIQDFCKYFQLKHLKNPVAVKSLKALLMLTPMENLNVFLLFKFKWYFIARQDLPLAISFFYFKIQDT